MMTGGAGVDDGKAAPAVQLLSVCGLSFVVSVCTKEENTFVISIYLQGCLQALIYI